MNKFEMDKAIALPLIDKAKENNGYLDKDDRMSLVRILQVSYHPSGKIEGLNSIDSCASYCGFCQKMREAAEGNPKHICGMCYACRGTLAFTAVKNRHELNMLILANVIFEVVDFYGLTRLTTRFNCDGDFDGVIHAGNAIKIAQANVRARFALWSKNYKAVQEAQKLYGKPSNLISIASSPIIDQEIPLPEGFDYTFTVYSTEEKVKEAIEKGSVACNGRKCKSDGYGCYFGTWPKGSNIAEILRRK